MSPSLLARQQRELQVLVRSPQSVPTSGLLREPEAERGLSVYQQAYRARLISALRDNHEVLHRALGDAEFEALALAYLHAQPPRHASLRWWGDGLADFMASLPVAGEASTESDLPRQQGQVLPHAALVDLARMDWALRMAFDAAESEALSAEDLRAVQPEAWPALRLRLRPGVQLLSLDWVVAPAWRRLRREALDLPAPEAGAEAEPRPLAPPEFGPHLCLVWRPQQETRWRSLAPLEGRLLQGLRSGCSFSDLCELAAEQLRDVEGADPAGMVVGCLQGWLQERLLLPLARP
ncbi:MAG: DNA-binding domain-containing protein [Paucibacter sp.]|nr:DNA-binding domain-containing protein [Roseateles sp.]